MLCLKTSTWQQHTQARKSIKRNHKTRQEKANTLVTLEHNHDDGVVVIVVLEVPNYPIFSQPVIFSQLHMFTPLKIGVF